jgi:hypothetical protein
VLGDAALDFKFSGARGADPVLMVPESVGAEALFVDEIGFGFDARDFREPGDRDVGNWTPAVFDHEAGMDPFGQVGRDDLESQRFRRDPAEVLRVGK